MEHHIDDIKNIREELNWRVKITYTSTAVFYTVIIFVLGIFVQEGRRFDMEDANLFISLSSTISMLITLFAVTLTANHLTEKKIELYILQIQKKILKSSPRAKTEIPKFSWISFLYADEYGHYLKSGKFVQRLHNFAIYVHPVFQFILPNLISLFILGLIAYQGFCGEQMFCKAHIVTLVYYIFVCIMCLASFILIAAFLIFFKKVKDEHRDFFYKHIHSYFTDDKR